MRQPSAESPTRRRAIRVVAAAAIVALVISNVASLVSDTFRDLAHDALVASGAIALLSVIPAVARALEHRMSVKETQALKQRAARAEKAHADLKREMQAKKARSAQVYKRIAARTAKSAAMNAGADVAEVVPVAGIAVILALTAADLAVACQTMQDLRELDEEATTSGEQQTVCGLTLPKLT